MRVCKQWQKFWVNGFFKWWCSRSISTLSEKVMSQTLVSIVNCSMYAPSFWELRQSLHLFLLFKVTHLPHGAVPPSTQQACVEKLLHPPLSNSSIGIKIKPQAAVNGPEIQRDKLLFDDESSRFPQRFLHFSRWAIFDWLHTVRVIKHLYGTKSTVRCRVRCVWWWTSVTALSIIYSMHVDKFTSDLKISNLGWKSIFIALYSVGCN